MDVAVTCGVGEPGVFVTVIAVGETTVDVRAGSGVKVSAVAVGRGVSDETGVEVGVMKIGDPNSRHPRSGAAPAKPRIGLGGTNSPLFVLN